MTLAFLPALLSPGCLDDVFRRKSAIFSTKKSRSLRLANRKVILFLVLIDKGLGRTLELSAFSTMVTWEGKNTGVCVLPYKDRKVL